MGTQALSERSCCGQFIFGHDCYKNHRTIWRRWDFDSKKTQRKLSPHQRQTVSPTTTIYIYIWFCPGTCATRPPSVPFNAATNHRTQFPQSHGAECMFGTKTAEAQPNAIRTTLVEFLLLCGATFRFTTHLYKFSFLDRIHSVAPELYNKSIVDYRQTHKALTRHFVC